MRRYRLFVEKKGREMTLKRKHYFGITAIMTLAVTLLVMPLIWVLVLRNINEGSAFALFTIAGLIIGGIASDIIKRMTKKEEKEIIAGMMIPLPAAFYIVFFLNTYAKSAIWSMMPDPLVSGLLFYSFFNLRFITEFFHHKKHKHYIGLYLISVSVILAALVMTDYSFGGKALIWESETVRSYAPLGTEQVRNAVTACIEKLALEKTSERTPYLMMDADKVLFEKEIEDYISSNLISCSGSDALKGVGVNVEMKPPVTDVTIGISDVYIIVDMQTIISGDDYETQIKEYAVRLS